uniref:Uncharacterized protein n=1 Tax=Micrurus surinamensis TaxID=129470 RepID=A0A2D4PP65_MICSU
MIYSYIRVLFQILQHTIIKHKLSVSHSLCLIIVYRSIWNKAPISMQISGRTQLLKSNIQTIRVVLLRYIVVSEFKGSNIYERVLLNATPFTIGKKQIKAGVSNGGDSKAYGLQLPEFLSQAEGIEVHKP